MQIEMLEAFVATRDDGVILRPARRRVAELICTLAVLDT
jgi:hypothetical protein